MSSLIPSTTMSSQGPRITVSSSAPGYISTWPQGSGIDDQPIWSYAGDVATGSVLWLSPDNVPLAELPYVAIYFTFTVPATGFEYWGYQRSDSGLISICWDCPVNVTQNAQVVDILNRTTIDPIINYSTQPAALLYSDYSLSYAVHNITISDLQDNRYSDGEASNDGYCQMSLDYFVLIQPAAESTSTASASASSTVPIASATSTPSASVGTSTVSRQGSNLGAIVGGAVGGSVALVIIAVLLYLLLRRRSQPNRAGDSKSIDGNPPISPMYNVPTTPFVMGGQNTMSFGAPMSSLAVSPPSSGTLAGDQRVFGNDAGPWTAVSGPRSMGGPPNMSEYAAAPVSPPVSTYGQAIGPAGASGLRSTATSPHEERNDPWQGDGSILGRSGTLPPRYMDVVTTPVSGGH